MKFTAHIGLGKTGTSAIQNALSEYPGSLSFQHKWPVLENGETVNHAWLRQEHSEEKTRIFYNTVVNHAKKSGCDHVVWSNEAISNNPEMVHLFRDLSRYSKDLDVNVILYVRDPARWLKSAWDQWGLVHKILKGRYYKKEGSDKFPTLTFDRWFKTWGRKTYSNWKRWKNVADIRPYKEGENIIDDFCEATGLDLPRVRAYETPTTSEVLSRAIYNNTYSEPVTPHKFDFYNTYGTLEEYTKRYLSPPNIEKFAKILYTKDLPINTILPHKNRSVTPDVRDRLLDQAIIFSIEAMGRIDQLEARVETLTNEIKKSNDKVESK